MLPEIKELYQELLKNNRTIVELKQRHHDQFYVEAKYLDALGIRITSDFSLSGYHTKVLEFLYPEQTWR